MKFHSKTLQATFEQAKPILERNTLIHDVICEDIQKLELFLKNILLNKAFSFNLHLPNTPAHQEELLVWEPEQQKILYIKNSYRASCIADAKGYSPRINYQEKENITEQALVDTDLSIKKQIWEHDKLALFLSLLTQKLLGKSNANSIRSLT